MTPRPIYLKYTLILCSQPPTGLVPSDFPINILKATLFSHIRATWPAHLILLDLITMALTFVRCNWVSCNISLFDWRDLCWGGTCEILGCLSVCRSVNSDFGNYAAPEPVSVFTAQYVRRQRLKMEHRSSLSVFRAECFVPVRQKLHSS